MQKLMTFKFSTENFRGFFEIMRSQEWVKATMLDPRKKQKQLIFSFLVCYTLSQSCTLLLFSEEINDATHPTKDHIVDKKSQPTYTINFSNVSILEYLKFISKIGDVNFAYNESDLNFPVTIVSEEPTDLTNILSALTQILKIHGLSIIENGSTLLINPAPLSPQIATIVSDHLPYDSDHPPALVTRVFKIRNGNPASIANILQTLLSQTALIEMSKETRHLIITDSSANINKVTDLLLTLDAPQSPLEIDAYNAHNNTAANLVMLANQIITPLSEGNPVIMVPQASTNTIFIVSTPFLIEKTLSILEDLDSSAIVHKEKILTGDNILLYQIQYKSTHLLEDALHQIATDLEQLGYAAEGLLETLDTSKYIDSTNALLFTGDPLTLKKVEELLAGIDIPDKRLPSASFYIYKPLYKNASTLIQILKNFADTLNNAASFNNSDLVNTIQSVKPIESSGTLLFTGDPTSILEIQDVLKNIDIAAPIDTTLANQRFFIYPVKYSTEEQLAGFLNDVAEKLDATHSPDTDLISAIDTMKWIEATHAFIFTGSEKGIKQLQELLTTFDVPHKDLKLSEFYSYNPEHLQGQDLLNAVADLAQNLEESGLANPILLSTLHNAKWVPASHALFFIGPQDVLDRIKTLMPTIDQVTSSEVNSVFIYHTQHLSPNVLSKTLQNLASNLPANDELAALIDSLKISDQSLVFHGHPPAIQKLKELLEVLDTTEQAHLISGAHTYFIYKLKNTSGDIIIQDLDKIVKNLEASQIDDKEFITAINQIEWIKSTNSLYIAGTPEAVNKIKKFIEDLDVSSKEQVINTYFIYKPHHLSAQEVLDKLQAIQQGFISSGLSNPALLSTLQSAQYVEANQSIIFTGSAVSLEEVKDILSSIESGQVVNPVHTIGKKQYLIYKLKYIPGPQLIGYLRSFNQNLTASNSDDSDLINTINSAKFVPETNSIMFTGSILALEELQKIIDKFDVASSAPQTTPAPSQAYVVYHPKNVSGEVLIGILHDFENQLVNSGLQQPDLFQAISNLKLLDQTGTITISGTEAAVNQIETLLAKFDVAGKEAPLPPKPVNEDISFLIYKLKYHQGSEIEDALKKIAGDITLQQGPDNSLAKTINALQWIQVTNSLISTGPPQALAKLKNLIENVDTPLPQIFIEVLVIETDVENGLNFGLRWGGQGQYRTKLGYSAGAFPNFAGGPTADPFSNFNTALQDISASTTPTGGVIPFSSGFGLGVIGDLIYHKGQSYTALGSLIDCLREDDTSTIVLAQKIVTQDNKPATVFVGDNIPFTGSTVQNAGSNSTVFSSNLEYKDIGVSLNLTPRVGDHGMITIDIDQEITEDINQGSATAATGSGNISGGGITNPSIYGITTSKTSMQTSATIPNKHFLILSGMMRNSKVKNQSGIPCLGGLPIIGAAFSNAAT